MLQLEILDEKLCKSDSWSDHDARTYGGLSNGLRLMLRELGLKGTVADKPPSLDAIAARHQASAAP
jgi:hypothetical protein